MGSGVCKVGHENIPFTIGDLRGAGQPKRFEVEEGSDLLAQALFSIGRYQQFSQIPAEFASH